MLICYIHLFIVLYNKSCRYGNNKNQIPYLFRKTQKKAYYSIKSFMPE